MQLSWLKLGSHKNRGTLAVDCVTCLFLALINLRETKEKRELKQLPILEHFPNTVDVSA
jgi:hypothetical protein